MPSIAVGSAIFVMYICLCSYSIVLGSDRDRLLERLVSESSRRHRGSVGRAKTPPSAALPPDPADAASDWIADEERFSASEASTTRSSRHSTSSRIPSELDLGILHPHLRRHSATRNRLSGARRSVASPVCPSKAEWKQLHAARDINNTLVEVFQPAPGESSSRRRAQWFYSVSCRNQALQSRRTCPDCCIGIDSTRYSSSCQQKQSYVMAYVRSPRQTKFHYSWILINSSCNCAISSLHDDL